MLTKLGMDENMPIESGWVTKALENAQTKVEGHNFDIRKHVVDYDDVMNTQRDVIYTERYKVLEGADLKTNILDMVRQELTAVVSANIPDDVPEHWDLDTMLAEVNAIVKLSDEFTPEAVAAMSAGRTAPLKSFLLDQSGVAGVGNIYADEALFRARLHPLSPAGSMRPEHHAALRDAVVEALEAGLAGGGASIDDYRDSRGEPGTMQDEFLVHTREGKPCTVCGTPIQRIVVSGRSTYYCPSCQVRLRRRRRPRRRSGAGRTGG